MPELLYKVSTSIPAASVDKSLPAVIQNTDKINRKARRRRKDKNGYYYAYVFSSFPSGNEDDNKTWKSRAMNVEADFHVSRIPGTTYIGEPGLISLGLRGARINLDIK